MPDGRVGCGEGGGQKFAKQNRLKQVIKMFTINQNVKVNQVKVQDDHNSYSVAS